MVRDDKPRGSFYLDHRGVDRRYHIITDSHLTPENKNDSEPNLQRLNSQVERFGFAIEAVG
ncbi:hypothetical protein GCM10025791_04690 [Halioxenophilus aromaticivorans]|uniref:Transposase n=1 Tax=Halioxenophilus aromaticivorans TaxID=1306992 RepID=A0AAV3TXC7_9ALTE